jgi:hypothetical protein
MYGRPFAIAAAVGIWIAAPVTAEPAPKPEQAKPAGPRAPAMLAAAEVKLPTGVKVDQSEAPKPKRNARVTTCRCADVSAAAPQN